MSVWENNYQNGRYNTYPYDDVVSYTVKNIKNNSVILDLGCGGGNHSKYFLNLGHKVYAVDGSSESLKITKIFCQRHPNLICLKNDFKHIDIPDESIDFILDRQSIGYNCLEDIKVIVQELHRVLKKGGKFLSFIFSINNSHLKDLIHKGNNDYISYEGYWGAVGLHHYTSIEELKELYKNFLIIDFKTVTVKNINNEIRQHYIIELEK